MATKTVCQAGTDWQRTSGLGRSKVRPEAAFARIVSTTRVRAHALTPSFPILTLCFQRLTPDGNAIAQQFVWSRVRQRMIVPKRKLLGWLSAAVVGLCCQASPAQAGAIQLTDVTELSPGGLIVSAVAKQSIACLNNSYAPTPPLANTALARRSYIMPV